MLQLCVGEVREGGRVNTPRRLRQAVRSSLIKFNNNQRITLMFLTILLNVLMLAGTFCTALGLLTVFYWCKKSDKPADESNRINRISCWWLGLTRPEVLAKSYKYFRQDVMDNVEDVEKTNKQ